ncbi:hypothetical protein ACFL31_00125 [Candidatus Margulisiibacteriota bacterium]
MKNSGPIDFRSYQIKRQTEAGAQAWLGTRRARRLQAHQHVVSAIYQRSFTYSFFLFHQPSAEEIHLHPQERKLWNELLAAVEKQENLDLMIDEIRPETHYLKGDTVIMVKATRPFCDIFPTHPGHRPIGEWEGWIGKVRDSHFVGRPNDGPNSETRIHHGFTLEEARRITEEEVKILIKAKHYEFPEDVSKLKGFPLGTEGVMISAPFPNLKLTVVSHIKKEDEKLVRHLGGDLSFDLLPHYGGQPRLAEGRIAFFIGDLQQEHAPPTLVVERTDLENLFATIWPQVKLSVQNRQEIQQSQWVFRLHLGKVVHPNFTDPDWDKIESVAPSIRNRWMYRLLTERGIHCPGQSIIFPHYSFSQGIYGESKAKAALHEAQRHITALIRKLLRGQTVDTNLAITYFGFERDQDQMIAHLDNNDFRQLNTLYAMGEYIDIPIV